MKINFNPPILKKNQKNKAGTGRGVARRRSFCQDPNEIIFQNKLKFIFILMQDSVHLLYKPLNLIPCQIQSLPQAQDS